MPLIDPAIAPEHWQLSDSGRVAATGLASLLPANAILVSSAEPKAVQTLSPAGLVTPDPRFNEVKRVEAFSDSFRVARQSYVEGADHPDWERRAEVAQRFGAGIAAYDGRPLVIASHGMAMTLWLTARLGLPDPGAFWAALRFPDAHLIDLGSGKVTRL